MGTWRLIYAIADLRGACAEECHYRLALVGAGESENANLCATGRSASPSATVWAKSPPRCRRFTKPLQMVCDAF